MKTRYTNYFKHIGACVALIFAAAMILFSSCTMEEEPSSFTVTFVVNGGSEVAVQTVAAGGLAIKPIDPTKDGYTFAGWFTNSTLTTAFEFSTPITQNRTIYAKWTEYVEPVSYTVTFDVGGGSAVDAQTVTSGGTATKPADPSRTGYTFGGWYCDSECKTAFSFTTAIAADTTIYAKWNVISYTVTFVSNEGSAVASQTVTYGSTATKPSDPTKRGYTFGGWYLDDTFATVFSFGTAIEGNITLYAKWIDASVTTFTVSFVTNEGTSVEHQTVVKGEVVSAPTTTRTGYSFGGWYSDSSLTTSFDFSTAITADITLYAKWNVVLVTYTVTFNSNSGSSVNAQTIESGKTAAEPTEPTREGYSFAGWYSNSALTAAFSFTTAITADITLYAKWTVAAGNEVTISSTANDLGNWSSFTLAASYFKDFTEGGQIIVTTEASSSIADPEYYNIKLLSSSWSPVFTSGSCSGGTINNSTGIIVPSSASGTITYTTTSSDVTTLISSGLRIQGYALSVTKVVIIPNTVKYTVTFVTNGGNAIDQQTVVKGNAAVTPTVPTYSGYTFCGWYSNSSLTTSFSFSSTITSDITLYAKWALTVNSYAKIDWTKDSAKAALNCLHVGWNLGNSLDGHSDSNGYSTYTDANITSYEMQWGNPVITAALLNGVKSAGFDFVRIPVTWMQNIDPSSGTSYTIKTAYMNRVKAVVDMAIDAGLVCVINVHHDGAKSNTSSDGYWLDIADAVADSTAKDKMTAELTTVWTQIATAFEGYDKYLMFEGMNEIQDGGWCWSSAYKSNPTAQTKIVDEWNQAFVTAVRATGGNNVYRYLAIPGYSTDPSATVSYLSIPTDPQQTKDGVKRLIITFHYYQPSDFCLNGTVQKWGSAAVGGSEDTLKTAFNSVKSTFADNGYGVYVGEYGAVYQGSTYVDYERYYDEYLTRYALDCGFLPIIWDNNAFSSGETYGLIDRSTNAPNSAVSTVVDGIIKAAYTDTSISDVIAP